MEKPNLITFWKSFFTDLLTGAVLSLCLFALGGFALGMLSVYLLNRLFMEAGSWWLLLGVPPALAWYGAWGVFHGLASSIAFTASRKIFEMVGGLQDLLDLLSVETIGKKFEKNISKEELAEKFDLLGKKFLDDLRLKKGFLYLPARVVYGTILKGLKFFFLNDVREELLKSPNTEITSSEIESAVRRASVELILSPIQDNFILIQILNCVLMAMSFGFPFWLLGKLL